ncbi:MAG: methylated-DNA--[protein]-cysteine S-methyltransferase [Verrucomicrobia bacterium]|nr:methylated-DNA--[protein]-cysteine S-methyltransferase [Verrucomicrobiota bacterium]
MARTRHRGVGIALACDGLTLRVESTARGVSRIEFHQGQPERLPLQLQRQLERYFAGEPVRFRVPLDLRAGTAFQQKVWRVLQRIPHGQTRSYAWVARQMGCPRAARAVGAACGANPAPILVPCHRVVRSDGSLGGFSAGLARKRALLRLEGCCIPSRRPA